MTLVDAALVATGEILDIAVVDGDLAHEEGLRTAVLISLLTDALAPPDAALPDAGEDRRGWWASELLRRELGDPVGGLLWLLERSHLSNAVLSAAEDYARGALAWLVREDIVARVEVAGTRLDYQTLLLDVKLYRGRARARAEAWAAMRSADLEVGPARIKLVALP